MSRWAPVLQRHLEELVRLNEKLVQSLETRHAAMIKRDLPALESILAVEGQLTRAMAEEERKRQMTVIRLAGELGRKPQEIAGLKLSAIAAAVGGPEGRRLLELGARLKELAGQARHSNQVMTALAQRLLPHFEELLELLLTGTVGQRAYRPDGQSVRPAASAMTVVDMRA